MTPDNQASQMVNYFIDGIPESRTALTSALNCSWKCCERIQNEYRHLYKTKKITAKFYKEMDSYWQQVKACINSKNLT